MLLICIRSALSTSALPAVPRFQRLEGAERRFTHKWLRSTALGTLGAALGLTAGAFQPLITDDTGTQGVGGNQIELALNQIRTSTGGTTERTDGLPFVYTRGVADTVDVYAGVTYLALRPGGSRQQGMSNPAIGSKWRFLDITEAGTSAAVKAELLLPVSSHAERSGLGSAALGGNLTVILSQDVPFGTLLVNLAAGRRRRSEHSPDAIPVRLSAAPVWQVRAGWKLALDLGGEIVKAGDQVLRTRFAELGSIWSPNDDLDLSLGLLNSVDNQTPRSTAWFATAGATWRFR